MTSSSKEALIKSMRNLKSCRTRILGSMPPPGSHIDLLENLGSLWDEFSIRYGEFDEVLDGMEDPAAKKIRDKFVTGKSLEDYYKEAETVYAEADTKLNKLIQDCVDKKKKQDKFRVERDLNISMSAINGLVNLIGEDNLDRPENLQVTGEPRIQELKMITRRLNKCLSDQQDNIDSTEEVEDVQDDLVTRAKHLVERYKALGDNFDLKLDSLLAGSDYQSTPANNLAATPVTTPHVTTPLTHAVRRLDLTCPSTMGGQYVSSVSPGMASEDHLGVNGSMVGPIHSTPIRNSFRSHEYTINPAMQVRSSLNTYPATHSTAMKMKYQDWPVFSGLWPDWPRFYSKWKNIVEAQGFSGKNLAEQLLECVKGEAYNRIQAVIIVDDTSYITMWNRLLRLYTDPGTLLSWVYRQLEDFKQVHEGNHQEIVTFANDLEKIYSDLFQIDESFPGRIIANKIDELAFLLPPSMLERWNRRYVKLDLEAKLAPFAQFVSYCCEQRDVHDRYLQLYPKSSGKSGKFSGFQDGDAGNSSGYAGKGAGKPPGGQGGAPSGSYNKSNGSGGSSPVCWMTPGHTGHWTRQCSDFRALTTDERRKKILSSKKCILCLEAYHKDHKCSLPQNVIDRIRCKKSDCPSKIKHRRDVACNSILSSPVEDDSKDAIVGSIFSTSNMFVAIYSVQVPCQIPHLTVFCDNGSNVSLIYEGTARRYHFKLVGRRKLRVRTINGITDRDSFIFEVPAVTKDGIVVVLCYSTPDYINNYIPKLDLKALKGTFPNYNKDLKSLQRPDGPVEVLFGVDCFGLHPKHTVAMSGNLAILRGPLGDTVVGVQESTQLGNQFSIQEVRDNFYVCKEASLELDKFIFGEEVGIHTKGACKSCSTCPRCVLLSHQEQQELQLVRQGLHFNESVPRWETALPFVSPKESLPDNYGSALASLASTERTLYKDPAWCKVYHQNIHDYVSKGYARKVSKEEAKSREGLSRWFLPHLAVLNPGSITTPVRTVFDSGRKYQGICLNDIMVKGPRTQINRSLDVAIRWREYPEVMIGDIKAMFHHIGVIPEDQWFQSFLFREDPSKNAEWYVMQVLIMGHICSPCIATESIYSTGDRVEESKPEVCYVLKNSSYVDDVVHSSIGGSLSLARDVHTVLKEHGFQVKQWQFSGESAGRNEEALFSEGSPKSSVKSLLKGGGNLKVLGIGWSPVEDVIRFKAEFNFSSKRRGIRSGPDVTLESLAGSIPQILTKRIVLEQVMRCYDPIGFAGPHILVAKLLLRKTWELGSGWDDGIPPDLFHEWVSWFKVSFELSDLVFPRCTRPVLVLDECPWLIILSDGSQKAYGFVAYVRWQISERVYSGFFMLAKNRIAPVNSVCIPRMELNGSLLGARGREIIIGCCRYKFSRIIHLVDSETVLCQVSSLATRFKVYESGRIGEIQTICEGAMQDWFWLPTDHNVSDWNTRGKSPSELGLGSVWQEGPEFLRKPVCDWPIKSVKEIRKQVEVHSSFIDSLMEEVEIFSIQCSWLSYKNTSRWEILVCGLALVIGCIRSKRFCRTHITPSLFNEAKCVILKDVQICLLPELDSVTPEKSSQSKYKVLSPVLTSEGIWCVGGRVRVQDLSGLPVLLPSGHPVALLLMQRAHIRSRHAGVYSSLCKFREEFYVIQGSKLAKRVRQRCSLCRRIDQRTVTQKMGKIPLHLLQEAPVFNYVQLDIFGPWLVRGEVQKRTTGKCWGVLFVCLNARALHIEFIAGYSTEDFLLGFQRFTSLRGWPAKVYSDPGSQLIAADKELRSMWKSMDMDKVSKELSQHGTEWLFSPADSPHRQGVVESLIGSVKRSIKVMYGHGLRLSWQEYVTIGHQVSDLINSRPLGVRSEVGDSLEILTPNNLILGRNSSDNPGNWSDISSCPRLSTINKIVTSFWAKWMQVVRPAMLLERKWNTEVRNLCVNDVVLVLENDSTSNTYKLAKVCEANPDEDGRVRTVKVIYKNYNTGTAKYSGSTDIKVSRSVQRLCLIVPVEEDRTHDNNY